MRPIAALTLMLVSACAPMLWGAHDDNVTTTIGLPADSVLRVATTQLEHHGFLVHDLGGGVLITAPQAVPSHLTEDASEQWMLRVQVEPLSFVRGSRVTVRGYTLPPGVTLASTNQVSRNAIPVTTVRTPRLFREVEAAAGWINDAAARRRAGQ
ncbi:MAG TPA: hypothetical protein VMM18_05210 [Gemmatimonadaceae bacterium]|nr:hypothetical protein [Gemmatimonadaceae bacterium]